MPVERGNIAANLVDRLILRQYDSDTGHSIIVRVADDPVAGLSEFLEQLASLKLESRRARVLKKQAGREQPDAADVTDARVLGLQCFKAIA